MIKIPCPIEGLLLYEAKKFGDQRGYFFESYRQDRFQAWVDTPNRFVQDNVSKSNRGTLRGLHFQAHHMLKLNLCMSLKVKFLM